MGASILWSFGVFGQVNRRGEDREETNKPIDILYKRVRVCLSSAQVNWSLIDDTWH